MNYALKILKSDLDELKTEKEAWADIEGIHPLTFEIIDRRISHLNEAIAILESINLMGNDMKLESKLNFESD